MKRDETSGGSFTVAGSIRAGFAWVVFVLATAACSVPGVYVVEQTRCSGGPGSGATAKFDATAYAEKIWASKVVPTATAKAVDASTLLPALQADSAAASKQYGKQAGSGAPYSSSSRAPARSPPSAVETRSAAFRSMSPARGRPRSILPSDRPSSALLSATPSGSSTSASSPTRSTTPMRPPP